MSEQNKFLEDLGNDQNREVDILDQPLDPAAAKEEGKQEDGATGEEGDGGVHKEEGAEGEEGDGLGKDVKPRNRRERRLVRKLQEERESSIFLAGKLEAREEAKRAVGSEEADYLGAVERIYGTETPEAQLATELLKKALVGVRDDAEARALAKYREERQQEQEAQRKAESELDNIVDDIEDTYDVTLTEPQERSFLQLLQKMSPKDKNGNVISLADPHAVWEVFQDKLKGKGTDNRAKTLSARSMTQSGAAKDSKLGEDATTRFLQESGII